MTQQEPMRGRQMNTIAGFPALQVTASRNTVARNVTHLWLNDQEERGQHEQDREVADCSRFAGGADGGQCAGLYVH